MGEIKMFTLTIDTTRDKKEIKYFNNYKSNQ